MLKNAYARYRQMNLETASPGKAVLYLYNGMIRFFSEAKEHMINKEYEMCNEKLFRARRILSELTLALNDDAGEISDNLRAIYNFCYQSSVVANLRKEPQLLEQVISWLSAIRDAWAQMLTNPQNEETQNQDQESSNSGQEQLKKVA